jgi:deazaflavin-dependent oxidoreductase (nitroreductase family)
MPKNLGATPVGVWAIKRVVSPLQRWIYRLTGGKFFSTIGSNRKILLLTTKGRRSGKDRTVPVFYLRDGETIVICNVRPEHEPGTNPWVLNLRKHPSAKLQIGADIAQYHAREASLAEVERLWPSLVTLWPAYQAHYELGGQRTIFILEHTYVHKA